MTKEQTIERITAYLPQLEEAVLSSVLTLLENIQPELDDWDRQMIADAESGKLDALMEAALEAERQGETTDLLEGLAQVRQEEV